MTSLELLAPARTADIGIAAIRCGADAVYIGGPSFGARAAAGNSVEDIKLLCREASFYGVRVYVTVNTLTSDAKEKEALVRMILSMKDIGVSAFIMQDESLPSLLAEYGPWREEFHASTQCTITGPERAAELVRAGFSRLILERQLSLEQIREIRSAVPSCVELECFVHGALCVCYSGACFLSEYLTGRSANRGECSQPCRSRYNLVRDDGKVLARNQALLSLKDLNLSAHLAELADAGVVSFKIEGRLKDASYVKNVVRHYSLELDRLIEAGEGRYRRASFGHCTGGFVPDVNKTFNRSYTSLYLEGSRGDWCSGVATKGVGEYIGKVGRVRTEGRSAIFRISSDKIIGNGDGLCFATPAGGLAGLRADRVRTLSATCGWAQDGKLQGPENRQDDSTILQEIECKSNAQLKEGADLWRNNDLKFEKELENNMPRRLMDVALELKTDWEEDSCRWTLVAVREDGTRKNLILGPVAMQKADRQERMAGIYATQLGKASGRHSFSLRSVQGDLPLMGAAAINALRRQLSESLDAIIAATPPRYEPLPPLPAQGPESQARSLLPTLDNACQSSTPLLKQGPEGQAFSPEAAQDIVDRAKQTSSPLPTQDPESQAFSPAHTRARPLMTSRYCILYELGLCRKNEQGRRLIANHTVSLHNNGKVFPLACDCKNCTMSVCYMQKK